jgi:outer membrane receptor for ferrienterochelin and colicin
MKVVKFIFCVVGLLALALPALAQVPTGTLAGRVDDGKESLPGVLVMVTSPSLQGARTTTSSNSGDYILTFLPPGQYKVRFELQGFQTQETTVKLNAAQTQTLNATMPQAKVAEEVTVTGTYETVSTTTTGATTLEQKTLEKLPVARTIQTYLSLAPGVHSTGPSGNWSISGAQSYENLYLINGVVVNENLRGQPVDAYIEDAIQETTTSVSGISAEYGRFAGGVVNVLTKSGGNEMHGSVRLALSKASWSEKTPLTVGILNDTLNKAWEATLGGFVLKDKLWYFVAGRKTDRNISLQTYQTLIPFTEGISDQRIEGKLTFSPTANHRFVGNYLDRKQTWTNYFFTANLVDLTEIYDRQIPETLKAFNYNGVFTDNFFVEGQYSERTLEFQNSGGRYRDMIKGTEIFDRSGGGRGNSPTFCGVCEPEDRNNKDYLVKASYFLSSQKGGSHDVVLGADSYEDFHLSMNHQSGSDWQLRVPSFIFQGTSWYPKVATSSTASAAQTLIYWWPILEQSVGSKFKVLSVFANDRWRLSNNWSFNIGLRYDKNNATNAWDKVVSNDSKISPRLGLTFDPKADGEWMFTAGYANYVTSLANTGNVGDASPAGNPSAVVWGYTGPAINTGAGPYVSPAAALQQVWDWFNNTYCDSNGNCGAKNLTNVTAYSLPGYSPIIVGSLRSPFAEEMTVGAVKRLGTRGVVRLDYVHRAFKDLYEQVTAGPGANGKVPINLLGLSTTVDLVLTQNSSFLTRKYDGVNLQAQYNLDRWTFGGIYTWSHSYGNFDGETAGSGPVSGTNPYAYYPEYRQQSWNSPTRDLSIDQRHRARLWASWDAIANRHNRLSIGVLERYESGSPYSATGAVRSYLYVTNPGYITRPSSVGYYFSKPAQFTSPNITNTDLSFNYSFVFTGLGASFEIYVIPQITNVFNEKNAVTVDATVYDATTQSYLANFNPFTTKPVECPQGTAGAACTAMGANWQKGPNFGKPTTTTAYQTPRTFSIAVGFRF